METGQSSDFTDSIISVPINTRLFHAPTDEAIVLIGLVKALGFVNEEPVVNIYLQVTRGRAKGSDERERRSSKTFKKPRQHDEEQIQSKDNKFTLNDEFIHTHTHTHTHSSF